MCGSYQITDNCTTLAPLFEDDDDDNESNHYCEVNNVSIEIERDEE